MSDVGASLKIIIHFYVIICLPKCPARAIKYSRQHLEGEGDMARQRQKERERDRERGSETCFWGCLATGFHAPSVPIFGVLITHLGQLPQTDGFNMCPQRTYTRTHRHTCTNTFLCVLISSYTSQQFFAKLNLLAVLRHL